MILADKARRNAQDFIENNTTLKCIMKDIEEKSTSGYFETLWMGKLQNMDLAFLDKYGYKVDYDALTHTTKISWYLDPS